ncbi:MAG: STAS domain-containing protein [Thermodesulfovibrionales bacterium]|jgi:anti-anti-sigma regulatory factor
MLNFSFERSHDAGILTFRGDITSRHNEDFKSALMVSISNAERVVVNFHEVSVFDRICLQTFCTAVRMAKRLRKSFVFNIFSVQKHIGGEVRECGFCDRLGCPLIRQPEDA